MEKWGLVIMWPPCLELGIQFHFSLSGTGNSQTELG